MRNATPAVVSTLALACLFGLPIAGAAIAIAAALFSFKSAKRAELDSGPLNRATSRLMVYLILPVILIVMGAVLWLLSKDEAIGATRSSIVESVAVAYGIPSLLSGVGMGIVFFRGVGKAIQDDRLFSRVLVYMMHPLTAAIFGLVISFLILGEMNRFVPIPIIPPPSGIAIESAWRVATFISIGGIAAPLSAILSTSYREAWQPRGMGRALIRSTIGESVAIIFLLLAFFSINA